MLLNPTKIQIKPQSFFKSENDMESCSTSTAILKVEESEGAGRPSGSVG